MYQEDRSLSVTLTRRIAAAWYPIMQEVDKMHVETLKKTGNSPGAPPAERRGSTRFEPETPVRLALPVPNRTGLLVGRSRALNMSASGMLVASELPLELGRRVRVEIPTQDFPFDVFMPEQFVGDAEVVRIEQDNGIRALAALRFGPQLATDMEFTVFCSFMQNQDDSPSAILAPDTRPAANY